MKHFERFEWTGYCTVAFVYQVQVGDQVILESMKSPGQYLHVSKSLFGKNYVYSLRCIHTLFLTPSGYHSVADPRGGGTPGAYPPFH